MEFKLDIKDEVLEAGIVTTDQLAHQFERVYVDSSV